MRENTDMVKRSKSPAGLTDKQIAELSQALGSEPSLLAHAVGTDVACAATPAEFCVNKDNKWQIIGWQEIYTGSWDGVQGTLTWQLMDDTQGSAVLPMPGSLPHVFHERVQASIVVVEQDDIDHSGNKVVIAGRKNPGAAGPITWTAQPLASTNLSDPAVHEFIVQRTAQLQAEYGE